MFDWFIWKGSGLRQQIGRVKSRRQTPLRPLINGVCRLRAWLLAPSQCLCAVNKVLLFKHVRAWQFSFSFEIESPGAGNGPMMQNLPPGCRWCPDACWAINRWRLLLVFRGHPWRDVSEPPAVSRMKRREEAWRRCSVWEPEGPTPESRGWLVQRGHALKVACCRAPLSCISDLRHWRCWSLSQQSLGERSEVTSNGPLHWCTHASLGYIFTHSTFLLFYVWCPCLVHEILPFSISSTSDIWIKTVMQGGIFILHLTAVFYENEIYTTEIWVGL